MKISVVCPFYNEALIIEKAAEGMIDNLEKAGLDYELIVVNDGSKDNSADLIRNVLAPWPRARVISYPHNQGRGFALKTGIDAATGDLIITTEIDLSWGDSVVTDIIDKFRAEPELDVVVASPNLKDGGYKNVPFKRVFVSKLGNLILRILFTKKVTMNTGMTRGYVRGIIQNLPVDEKGKEFHLEVLLKLTMLGARIGEVPAILEWKEQKYSKDASQKRKSSSKIPRLILSHLNFAVFANPIRYLWGFAIVCVIAATGFMAAAFFRFFTGETSINLALMSLIFGLFGFLFFGFGVLTTQNNRLLRELWKIERTMNVRSPVSRDPSERES